MKRMKKLLFAVTAMSVLASVRAEIVDQVPNPDSPAPKASRSYFPFGVSTPYAFADIVNLPAGAEHRLPTDQRFNRVPDRTLVALSNISDSKSMRPAGANATGSLLIAGSTFDGALDNAPALAISDRLSPSRSGNAGSHAGAGFLFSAAEIPEPAGWVTLLCSLVVVASIARRKLGTFAD